MSAKTAALVAKEEEEGGAARMNRRSAMIVSAAKDAREYIDRCKAVRKLGISSDEISDEDIRNGAAMFTDEEPAELVDKIRVYKETSKTDATPVVKTI